MDMMSMGGGADYSPLYAQAKEILAAGMLAELAEDAKEAMGQGEGEGEDTCPHCGAPMGGEMGNPYATPKLSQPGLPPELAMRMPPAMSAPMNYSNPADQMSAPYMGA